VRKRLTDIRESLLQSGPQTLTSSDALEAGDVGSAPLASQSWLAGCALPGPPTLLAAARASMPKQCSDSVRVVTPPLASLPCGAVPVRRLQGGLEEVKGEEASESLSQVGSEAGLAEVQTAQLLQAVRSHAFAALAEQRLQAESELSEALRKAQEDIRRGAAEVLNEVTDCRRRDRDQLSEVQCRLTRLEEQREALLVTKPLPRGALPGTPKAVGQSGDRLGRSSSRAAQSARSGDGTRKPSRMRSLFCLRASPTREPSDEADQA